MTDQAINSTATTQDQERAAPQALEPQKGPGRPKGCTDDVMLARRADKGGTLEEAESAAKRRHVVKARQRKDCRELALTIKRAQKRGPGFPALDPVEVGNIARATKILHELEVRAYGLGDQGQKAGHIIVVPVPMASMGDWQQASDKAGLVPLVVAPKLVRSRLIEDDIQGEQPTRDGER